MSDKMQKAISFFKEKTPERLSAGLNNTEALKQMTEGKDETSEMPARKSTGLNNPEVWKQMIKRKAETPEMLLPAKIGKNDRKTPWTVLRDNAEKWKRLPLLTKGVETVSALFESRKRPSNAAPAEPETEKEASLEDYPGGNGNGASKEKAGWISPAYSQCRISSLDPAFLAENRCLAYLDNVPEAEAYRVLRTQVLQRTRSAGGNLIMVTSALPGEGKTITAINLAFTFAREFQHTVLLVDGDLRKQSIHKYVGCSGEKGLIDYLVDATPVSELLTYPGVEKMTLISGGASFKESAEILGSPRMKELIAEMKGRYPERYIIFDVPPILTGADVMTLAPLVDQVIVVVQAGKTSMADVKKALQFLPKEKILGFVLNRKQ